MNPEQRISQLVNPQEIEAAQFLLTEIRFECLVRIFDFASIEPASPFPFIKTRKSLPPKWFKLEQKLTLEFIKTSDPYAIGKAIKQGYEKLEAAIKEYEKHHK